MIDVTSGEGQGQPELSAADEQPLRKFTERVRAGGLRLSDEGVLLVG